jgi:hypothetical protein
MNIQEQAQKLVEASLRKASLAEKNWKLKLDINLMDDEFEGLDSDPRAAAEIVLKKLQAKKGEVETKLGKDLAYEYQGIIDSFQDIVGSSEEPSVGEFDSLMDELYDFGDRFDIWVG